MGMQFVNYTPGLRLVVLDSHEIEPAYWTSMVEDTRHAQVSQFRVLVVTDGGSPSLSQRKSLDAAMKEKKVRLRTAVVTESTSIRVVMSALSWLSKVEIKAFRPEDLPLAYRFLELSANEVTALQKDLGELCDKLDVRILKSATATTR